MIELKPNSDNIKANELTVAQRKSISRFVKLWEEREEFLAEAEGRTFEQFCDLKGFTKWNFYRMRNVFIKCGGTFE